MTGAKKTLDKKWSNLELSFTWKLLGALYAATTHYTIYFKVFKVPLPLVHVRWGYEFCTSVWMK